MADWLFYKSPTSRFPFAMWAEIKSRKPYSINIKDVRYPDGYPISHYSWICVLPEAEAKVLIAQLEAMTVEFKKFRAHFRTEAMKLLREQKRKWKDGTKT